MHFVGAKGKGNSKGKGKGKGLGKSNDNNRTWQGDAEYFPYKCTTAARRATKPQIAPRRRPRGAARTVSTGSKKRRAKSAAPKLCRTWHELQQHAQRFVASVSRQRQDRAGDVPKYYHQPEQFSRAAQAESTSPRQGCDRGSEADKLSVMRCGTPPHTVQSGSSAVGHGAVREVDRGSEAGCIASIKCIVDRFVRSVYGRSQYGRQYIAQARWPSSRHTGQTRAESTGAVTCHADDILVAARNVAQRCQAHPKGWRMQARTRAVPDTDDVGCHCDLLPLRIPTRTLQVCCHKSYEPHATHAEELTPRSL